MRLIDADKMLDEMRRMWEMQELYLPIHFEELLVNEQPTVMAWRPFKFDEDGLLFNIPEDGQEILVSRGYSVSHDIFEYDYEEYYLNSGKEIEEGMAWMPMPEPYKEERK